MANNKVAKKYGVIIATTRSQRRMYMYANPVSVNEIKE